MGKYNVSGLGMIYNIIVSHVCEDLFFKKQYNPALVFMVMYDDDDDDKLYFSVRSSSWPCKAY